MLGCIGIFQEIDRVADPTKLYILDEPKQFSNNGTYYAQLHVFHSDLLAVAEQMEGVDHIMRFPESPLVVYVWFSRLYDHEEVWCELDDALKDTARFKQTWANALD
jgi:hypothetical protein